MENIGPVTASVLKEKQIDVAANVPFQQMERPHWKKSRQQLWDLAIEEGNNLLNISLRLV